MRFLLVLVAASGTASAEPPRAPTCEAASVRVASLLSEKAEQRATIKMMIQRCDKDRWSAPARGCFAQAGTDRDAAGCLDQLSKDQQRALAGDADRSAQRRFGQWMSRRPATAIIIPKHASVFSLAVQTDAPDISKTRTLHAEGMTAYRNGRYDLAVRKFEAANDEDPSPELVYHLAQAYRLKGDHGRALELFEKYVELAPHGAAAADCHRQIDTLIDLP